MIKRIYFVKDRISRQKGLCSFSSDIKVNWSSEIGNGINMRSHAVLSSVAIQPDINMKAVVSIIWYYQNLTIVRIEI